jgi:hypothetical protein
MIRSADKSRFRKNENHYRVDLARGTGSTSTDGLIVTSMVSAALICFLSFPRARGASRPRAPDGGL